MTPPSAPDPADAAPDEATPVTGLTAAQAYELIDAHPADVLRIALVY